MHARAPKTFTPNSYKYSNHTNAQGQSLLQSMLIFGIDQSFGATTLITLFFVCGTNSPNTHYFAKS